MQYTHNSFTDEPIYIDPALSGNIQFKDDFGANVEWGEEENDNSLKIIVLNWYFRMINAATGKEGVRYVARDTFVVRLQFEEENRRKIEELIEDSAANFIKGWSNRKKNTIVMKKIITPPSNEKKSVLTDQIGKVLSHKK